MSIDLAEHAPGERCLFELTADQHAALLKAAESEPYLIAGDTPPPSAQDNAEAAWAALGRELGFDWQTVEAAEGRGEMFFTAVATELAAAPVAPVEQDQVTSALAEVSKSNVKITELAAIGRTMAAKYKGVVADVRTTKGYDQIAAIRTELREKVRYPMQDLQKDGSKLLGTMQRQFNERARELIEEAKGHETPFQEQLEAEDTRKENERLEAQRVEAARKQQHQDGVTAIALHVTQAAGFDVPQLQSTIGVVEAIEVDDSWEEYKGQAQQAKEEALRQLNGMLVAAKLDALERAELEQTRQQQAAFREQQAEQQRQLVAQAADLQRQRDEMAEQQRQLDAQREQQQRAQDERKQAVQRRIDGLGRYGAAYSNMAASENIRSELATLNDTLIYAELYDDRVSEAIAAKEAAMAYLRQILTEAEAREAEEARRALADRIQANIDALRGIVTAAHQATTSADLIVFHTKLRGAAILFEDFGDRSEEAEEAKEDGLSEISVLLQRAQEREAREADEAVHRLAEHDRQQEAELRARRLAAAAPRMFDLLKHALGAMAHIADPREGEARDLINEIEGDK